MTDYNQMKLKDLKQIGKDMGLLRVDKYNKHNKNELIEKLNGVPNLEIMVKIFY